MFSAQRVLAIRKSKGLSQELLAEQSGVSLRTIQRVEQGETVPRGHTMQALATVLAVPLAALLAAPAPGAAIVEKPTVSAVLPVPATPDAAAPPAPALPTPAHPPLPADPQLLQLLNLSARCLLVFPLLNLLVPYLLWRKHRHDTAHAAEVGRRVLGFQILWQVASFCSYLLVLLVQAVLLFSFGVVLKGVFLGVFVLTYLVNVGTVGYSQWRLCQGKLNLCPIRF